MINEDHLGIIRWLHRYKEVNKMDFEMVGREKKKKKTKSMKYESMD